MEIRTDHCLPDISSHAQVA